MGCICIFRNVRSIRWMSEICMKNIKKNMFKVWFWSEWFFNDNVNGFCDIYFIFDFFYYFYYNGDMYFFVVGSFCVWD